jgi:beta-galactosidase
VGDDADAKIPNYNDEDWKRVTLPYVSNEDDAFKKDIAGLTTGIAWYRKYFRLPLAAKAKKYL